MNIRSAAVFSALGFIAAACGNEKCPTESPEVRAVADCTAPPGQSIEYPIALCPTCNQTFSSCGVQVSGNDIFLSPAVEACTSSASCGAGCNLNASACAVTVPSAGGPYTVSVYDAAHPTQPREGTLTLGSSFSCTSLPQ